MDDEDYEEDSDECDEDDFVTDDQGDKVAGLASESWEVEGIEMVDEVVGHMEKMSLRKSPPPKNEPWSLGFSYPHVMYGYMEGRDTFVTIDWLVHGIAKEKFHPGVEVGGKAMLLNTLVPEFFLTRVV